MFQQRIVQVIIAVAAAGIAANLPGFLQVRIGDAIREGGALGAFTLVFAVNPASWATESPDNEFTNASCKDERPFSLFDRVVPVDSLPADYRPDAAGPIPRDSAPRRPVRFAFDYAFEPQPGPREWTQVQPGIWTEVYTDQNVAVVRREVGRDTVDGCNGTVVGPEDGTGLQVFIPDRGCAEMWIRFRVDEGEWSYLAEMRDVG